MSSVWLSITISSHDFGWLQIQKPQVKSDKTLYKPDYGLEITCQYDLREQEPTETGSDEKLGKTVTTKIWTQSNVKFLSLGP